MITIYKSNGQVLTEVSTGKWYIEKPVDPYNPLNLPDLTIRVKMMPGQTLTAIQHGSVTPVQGQSDVYDVCTTGFRIEHSWATLFQFGGAIKEVLGANATNVTNMYDLFGDQQHMTNVALFDTSNVTDMQAMFVNCTSLSSVPQFNTSSVTMMDFMFAGCTSLTSIPLYDTSNVTYMYNMCMNCTSLSSIPLFNTSNVTDMAGAFNGCVNVQSGALALYQQASTQANVPSHRFTFNDCGVNTVQGAAELAQIPDDWKTKLS